jgi:hypothetical protein
MLIFGIGHGFLPFWRSEAAKGGSAMDGSYYRDKAERCRLMSAIALVPEVKEQLRLWAHEFEDLAETHDRKHERQQRLRTWRNRLRQLRGAH